ncbi:hypothetical protein [Kaarinaea lacus]
MVTKTVGTNCKGTKNLAAKYPTTFVACASLYLVLFVSASIAIIKPSNAAPAPTQAQSEISATSSDTVTPANKIVESSESDTGAVTQIIPSPAGSSETSPLNNADDFNPNTKFQQAHLNTIPEDENSMRLLQVLIGRYMLDDLMVAYQKGDIIFIPLGFFSELIDMAIKADADSGIAKGFIFEEDRTFRLDAKRGEVIISGKLQRFNKQLAALRQFDDIYIDSNLLGKWLPMKLDVDLYGSRIKIISEKPLPFEQRKKREERIKQISLRAPIDRGFPKQEFPFQDWTIPLVNQTVRIGIQRDANEDFNSTFSYATYATADLMNMESSWYLSGTDGDVFEDVRGTFSKHDPDGLLLGEAKATEFAFGHINEPRIDLITQSLDPQIGALISNYPLTRQLQYDSHNFRGDLPPGWEVELYRNNNLLGYINSSENGQYQFDDVPLLFGTNYFRLVFYGPQGQQREETHNFTLNHSLTEPGKHYYRALISQDEDSGNRMLAQYDFGISKNISLNTNFSSLPIDDNLSTTVPQRTHNYLTAGLRGFHKSLFYKSDLILDMQSGSAVDWEIQSRIGAFIVNLGETYFQDNFISEVFPLTLASIKRRTELKVDTAIPASFLPRIPISFEMEQKNFEGNTEVTRYGNRISMQMHGLSLSNTLNRNQQTGLSTSMAGNFQISRRAYGYNFRGSISYQLSPENELSALTVTTDGIKLWDYHISTGFTHLTQSKTNEMIFNMTRSRGLYSLGLSSRYSTGGILSLDLTFAIGLGHEPRTNQWKAEYRPIASQGTMSVQTFIDKNSNGIKDSNEKGIADAKVKINGGNVNNISDKDGIIFITGVEPYREIDLELALETLDDPLWQPAVKGKRISLRPGYVAQINFPVVITGEIDGTAYVQFGNEKREVSGVIVELLDLDGKVFRSAKTAYDGFYLMDKIPAGKYQLRVSREQTNSLNLLPVQPTFVVIEPGNPIVNGMDFVLEKRGQ